METLIGQYAMSITMGFNDVKKVTKQSTYPFSKSKVQSMIREEKLSFMILQSVSLFTQISLKKLLNNNYSGRFSLLYRTTS